MNLEMKVTKVFKKNFDAFNQGVKFIVNEGGSSSSKSWSILQVLIAIALDKTKPKQRISIVSHSLPHLRKGVMADFFGIIDNMGIYSEVNHNKTSNMYTFDGTGTQVEFFSIDTEIKAKGPRRDILYINEANDIGFGIFNQLAIRTRQNVFIDYNPQDDTHWVYDLVNDPTTLLIKSTYKDNPFIPESQLEWIESLITKDENFYRIYVLGERPTSSARIYSHFKKYEDDTIEFDDICYGLDFGYTHVSTLIQCGYKENKLYIKELFYTPKLTAIDLVDKVKGLVDPKYPIYADYARPEIIEQMRRSHINVKEANKSVQDGIDTLKSSEVYIHHESTNTWKEYKNYSWKMIGDKIDFTTPVKAMDDSMDAIRYAAHTHKKKIKDFKIHYKFY